MITERKIALIAIIDLNTFYLLKVAFIFTIKKLIGKSIVKISKQIIWIILAIKYKAALNSRTMQLKVIAQDE